MMSRFLAFLVMALMVAPAAYADGALTDRLSIQTKSGKTYKFSIELALTPQQQQKGLMFRTHLADDKGMLFYFGDEAERGFWMKNTLIPLDIIFIKADGTIHRIYSRARPKDLTSIPSQGPVAAVLEIRGGLSRELGFQVGDTVKHAFFGHTISD